MEKFYTAHGGSASALAETFRKKGFCGTNPSYMTPVSTPASPASGSVSGPDLGIYAKSSTPPPADAAVRVKLQATRAERYVLLSAARRVFSAAGKRSGLQYGHDFHRTAKCKFVRVAPEVGVHQSKAHRSAFYSKLFTCGSVSACPVCAAKVSERRRDEVAQAVTWAYGRQLQPVMVTLTFPHQAWNKIGRLLDQQAAALKNLRAGKPWTKFKERYGYQGLIRALEITHGANGWHPHTHELWFVRPDADPVAMLADILKRWESACSRAGLLDLADPRQLAAFRAHAVDVKGNCSASDYLAKQDDSKHWGVDREIAKASTKAGRAKGVHPFGLLAKAAEGDTRSARLYLAYAIAMKGRRLLYWSQGLKDAVGLLDLTDEALSEEQRDDADLLGQINEDDWRTVREAGKRAAVLDAAENGGWPAVEKLLERLTLEEITRLEQSIAALGVP
jgi:hypothetical protein